MTEQTKLIAADISYYNTKHPLKTGRKVSLYHNKGTGFFITIETISDIESVDELTAREHYKFSQKKYRKFPKQT